MSTFETALKFWWGPPKCWGARGACLICLIVNPPLTVSKFNNPQSFRLLSQYIM